jgi:hypothetical protein
LKAFGDSNALESRDQTRHGTAKKESGKSSMEEA